jgi:hypothetical protein
VSPLLHRLLYPNSLSSFYLRFPRCQSSCADPVGTDQRPRIFDALLRTEWQRFCSQCSPIAERASLFGRFPEVAHFSFW